MQASNLPPSTGSDEEQCWKDVKAETGFSSYKSFLKSFPRWGPRFDWLLRRMDLRFGMPYSVPSNRNLGAVFVVDIFRDGSTSISLNMQINDVSSTEPFRNIQPSQVYSERKSSTQLLQNLRSPPENVPVRIVLWSITWEESLFPWIIDAIGLGLKIHPSFFEALPLNDIVKDKLLRPNGSDHISVGDYLATVAQNYRLGGRDPPVLVVIEVHDPIDPFFETEVQPHFHEMFNEFVEERIGGSVKLDRAPSEQCSPDDLALTWPNQTLYLLVKYFQKNHTFVSEDDPPPMAGILPLLDLEVWRVRSLTRAVNAAFRDIQFTRRNPGLFPDDDFSTEYNNLDTQRFWLRRKLEDLEESRSRFIKYVRSQKGAKWLESKAWLSQDEDIRDAIDEARTKEAEARDFMQIQIGNLSILESRKSIQLSNQQFSEARRGKTCGSTSLRVSY